jgi:hypothetical protein
MAYDRTAASNRTFGRTVAGGVLVALISTIIPLSLATPAFAARAKTVKITDASIVEGNTGSASMTFTVSWSGAKGGAGSVRVAYATANVTATAGSDYTAKSDTLTLSNTGCRCATIAVPVLADAMTEGTETFVVNLKNPVNATIADSQGVGTIYDDEGPASFVVSDASANESTGTITFAVLMTNSTQGTRTVNYATAADTASAGTDYTSKTGALTFNGQTSKNVSVTIFDDTLNEADETFNLVLSNGTITILDDTGVGTIVDDDAEPTISVSDATAAENNGPLAFTISLSTMSGQEVDVDYTTADGTAIAGDDYTQTSGTAVIPAGQTSAEIDVPVLHDATHESNETLTLDLSSPSNSSIVDAQGAGTITNDDAVSEASIGDVSLAEGDTGSTPATFDVTLNHASDTTATVNWATANGTVSAIDDYVSASGTVSFAPGETAKEVSVDVVGDTVHESDETFTVALSNPSGVTIGSGTGTATITNDDAVEVSIGDVTLAEGNTGSTPARFDVTLNGAAGTSVTVEWATADGTATAGTDYSAANGTVSFAPGDTMKQVSVDVLGDSVEEPDESFAVTLSNPSGAAVDTATGTATITNDDGAPVASVGDVSLPEGNTGLTPATFDVTLSHAAGTTVTVDWATTNGTATVVTDYVLGSGTVSFAPGETTKQVSVNVLGDILHESDETFTVMLSNPSGATIGTPVGTATITNDDAQAFTALTLKVRKTKTRVLANGTLERASAGVPVSVSLQKKHGKKWTLVKTRVVGVGGLRDKDGDAIPDAVYHTWFKRPARGVYRVRAIFAGTADLLTSNKTVRFKV